jgi:hypothetical protein
LAKIFLRWLAFPYPTRESREIPAIHFFAADAHGTRQTFLAGRLRLKDLAEAGPPGQNPPSLARENNIFIGFLLIRKVLGP